MIMAWRWALVAIVLVAAASPPLVRAGFQSDTTCKFVRANQDGNLGPVWKAHYNPQLRFSNGPSCNNFRQHILGLTSQKMVTAQTFETRMKTVVTSASLKKQLGALVTTTSFDQKTKTLANKTAVDDAIRRAVKGLSKELVRNLLQQSVHTRANPVRRRAASLFQASRRLPLLPCASQASGGTSVVVSSSPLEDCGTTPMCPMPPCAAPLTPPHHHHHTHGMARAQSKQVNSTKLECRQQVTAAEGACDAKV